VEYVFRKMGTFSQMDEVFLSTGTLIILLVFF